MKTKIIIITMFVLLGVLSSCRKEQVTIFPDYDRNWLVVDDDPNDAVIHDTYLFYQDTGIPIYFNDTIGIQERVDVFGNTYNHYEKLSLVYSLGGVQSGAIPLVYSFTYCDKSDVPAALDYLEDNIISAIPQGIYVPSILLVESMQTNAFGTYAYKGLNTIVIGEVSKIPTMADTTRQKYKGAILRAILTNAVLDSKYSDLLYKFYDESRKFSTQKDTYSMSMSYLNYNYYYNYIDAGGLEYSSSVTVQQLGFLSADPRNTWYTPMSTWIDVCMYIEAICGSTPAEFQQLYGSYPAIMAKYEYIEQILQDIGYQVQ